MVRERRRKGGRRAKGQQESGYTHTHTGIYTRV